MALTKPQWKVFNRQLAKACIALIPALDAIAETTLHPHQQSVCHADEKGQWQCQQEAATPGAYPQIQRAAIKAAPKPAAQTTRQPALNEQTIINPYSQWDWVPKEQLDDASLCETGCEGAYIAPVLATVAAGAPVTASADGSNMLGDDVVLTGNIEIRQDNSRLKADKVNFNRVSQQLFAEGNIEVREAGLLIRADSAELNINSQLGTFDNASFVQHSTGYRGQAQQIRRDTETTLNLEQGKITQCSPDDEVWAFYASNIHLDTEEGWGSAKHARLNIQDLPVLYIPYITFPIDERRKSGFLWPTLGTSGDNGFEITTPYYLNIAPNFDATVAPRYISERGTMTELEVRQLSQYGEWVVAGAQLKDDSFTETPTPSEAQDNPARENRWVGSIDQRGQILGLSTLIAYTKASDEDYFRDLSTNSLDVKRASHLNQTAGLGFSTESWNSSIRVQQYQTLDKLLDQQYRLLPQFSLARNTTGANFEAEWLLTTEFTDFQHDQSIDDGGTFVTGKRAFAETGFSYPMHWAAGFIIPTAKIRTISYDLEAVNPGSDDTPSATSPLATLDMGLIFERPLQFGNNSFVQTLEPRLYYFYSDYDEQDNNPLFDSQQLEFSFSQLFRDSRFSGHDRLDDAKQMSVGLTSRFIEDSDGREVLSLSIGQIFYFEDRKVSITAGNSAEDYNEDSQSSSSIASEIQYQPIENLWLTNSLLWNHHQNQIDEGGFSLHYQTEFNSLYNIGYRYRREGAGNTFTTENQDLSQADASILLPISDSWSVFSRFHYDIEQHSSLEQMAGFQYEDCCWMLRIIYQRAVDDYQINSINGALETEYDEAFIVEFQLKGLGNSRKQASGLLKESILGYEDLE